MTAITHGFNEESELIRASMDVAEEKLPKVIPGAKYIRPPLPVHRAQANWPLLTVSRYVTTFSLDQMNVQATYYILYENASMLFVVS